MGRILKHRTKIGTIFFVSLLALAGIGISYAGLTDTIDIFGTVQTAAIKFQDVSYTGTYVNDMSVIPREPYSGEPTLPPTGIPFSKTFDIAVECNQLYYDQPEQIFNAWINFTIETIPVIINNLSFSVVEENDWYWLNELIQEGHVDLTMTVIRNNVPIEVDEGSQLHPGEDISIHLSLTLSTDMNTFDEDLEVLVVEEYSGVMMIHLEVIQWTGLCEEDEVPGSDPECQTETAWGGNNGVNINDPGAWWYYYDTNGDETQTIWAGQTIDVGTVKVVDGTIYLTLTDGWELQDDGEAVKIGGYEIIPDSRPSAGNYELSSGTTLYKGTDLIVDVEHYDYYAIHLDVQLCLV